MNPISSLASSSLSSLSSLPAASLTSAFGTPDSTDTSASAGGPSFAQTLQGALGQVSSLQDHAGQMAQDFARGKTSDVHSVMIASEQATVALQLTTQIRNHVVDAYQEIMRISM